VRKEKRENTKKKEGSRREKKAEDEEGSRVRLEWRGGVYIPEKKPQPDKPEKGGRKKKNQKERDEGREEDPGNARSIVDELRIQNSKKSTL